MFEGHGTDGRGRLNGTRRTAGWASRESDLASRRRSRSTGLLPTLRIRNVAGQARRRTRSVRTSETSVENGALGRYMAAPATALVLCVDEKPRSALDRSTTAPADAPGQVGRRTHDDIRPGTTSLFAALDIATRRVIGKSVGQDRCGRSAFLPGLAAAPRQPRSGRHDCVAQSDRASRFEREGWGFESLRGRQQVRIATPAPPTRAEGRRRVSSKATSAEAGSVQGP